MDRPSVTAAPAVGAAGRRRQHLADAGFVGFIALCIVVAWYSLHYHGQRLEQETLAARAQVADLDTQHLASHLSLTLRGVDLTLQTLLETGPPVDAVYTWNGLLREALRNSPQLRSLSLLDGTGTVIASSNPANLGQHPSLARFLPQAAPFAPTLRLGPPQGGRDLADAAPISAEEAPPPLYFVPLLRGLHTPDGDGVYLLAALNMDFFTNGGALPVRGTTDHLEVINFEGQRVLDDDAPRTPEMRAADLALVERWKTGDEHGVVHLDTADGATYSVAYRLPRNLPLGVVARFNHAEALSGARAERARQERYLLPAVGLSLGGTLFGYFLFRRAGRRERLAREAAESALRASEERYRLTMGAVRDGMWEWHVDTGALSWDARCFEQLGFPPDGFELDIERWKARIHPEDHARLLPMMDEMATSAEGFRIEFRMPDMNGDWHWLEARGKVVEWRGDTPLRVVGTQTDIHVRKTSEIRLRLLEAALNAAANAVVITNTDAVIEWVNPAFAALSGYTEDDAIGRTPRELIKSGVQSGEYYAALWNTILAGDVWRGELINRRRDGQLYHEALTITPMRDENGTLDHFIAVKEDISARKAAEAELEATHARLQAVVDNFPGAVLFEDADGTITLANQMLCSLLGIDERASALVGRPSVELVADAAPNFTDAAAFVARIRDLRAGARPVHGEELETLGGRWLERDFLPVRSGDTLLGFLRLYRDVTERKHHEQALQRLATLDPLTGTWNRRAFLERAEHERLRYLRSEHPASLVMLDLDHFKRVNDTWGHAAGDAVLCHFVRVLQQRLRATDLLGRLGGEEFALLLVDTTPEGAAELTERLRAAIAEHPLPLGDRTISITVSAGIAPFVQDDQNVEAALARADAALYRAKARGRNQVVLADDECGTAR